MASRDRTRTTAEQYYDSPEYAAHDLIQLIAGEVVIGMPPSLKHQRTSIKLSAWLLDVEEAQGGIHYVAPADVRLDDYNSYEPDLFYIAPGSDAVLQDNRVIGAPDLVIEILSPRTAQYDRGTKQAVYARNGVREYWLVDPEAQTVEVLVLSGDTFEAQGTHTNTATFRSAVLDRDVPLERIFA